LFRSHPICLDLVFLSLPLCTYLHLSVCHVGIALSRLHHRYLTVRTISLSPLHKRLTPPINVLPTLPLIVHCVTKMRNGLHLVSYLILLFLPDREQWGVKCRMEDET
jgi:hypothetical protein